MSLRAVVVVPAWSVPGIVGADAALTASFALAGPGAPHRVERAGTPAAHTGGADADPLVSAFLAACADVGRPLPRGVRVRATSRVPPHLTPGGVAASAVAGVAAANALLGLGLAERDVARVAAAVAGGPAYVAAALRGHRVAVRHTCEDDVPPAPPASMAPRVTGA